MTWGRHYWPWWALAFFLFFAVAEGIALFGGNADNTLSYWVWHTLQVQRNVPISQWGAVRTLTFAIWSVIMVWLTFHFFFHIWT